MKIEVDKVLKRKVKKVGNGCHVILPIELLDKSVWILTPPKKTQKVDVKLDPRIPKEVHKGFWKEHERTEKEFDELGKKDGYWGKGK